MKKKFLVSSLAVVLCLSLTSCKLPFGNKGEAENPETEVTATDGPSDNLAMPGVEPLEKPPESTYLTNVGDSEDPYSGMMGIGLTTIDAGSTYAQVKGFMSLYDEIASVVDDKSYVAIDDDTLVPEFGYFTVSYAPKGVTNVADKKVITFEFATPWDMEENMMHRNMKDLPLNEFPIHKVTFYVHDGENLTGSSWTIPGYHTEVLTKSDVIAALGGENKEYLTEMSSSCKFFKENTCFSDISVQFGSNDNIDCVELEYDVNFGVSEEDLGLSVPEIDFDISAFQSYIDSDVTEGQYYGFYQKDGVAQFMFVASPENVNATSSTAYVADMFGIVDDAIYKYTEVTSSAGDDMCIRISSDGLIGVGSANQIVTFAINTETGEAVVQDSVIRNVYEDGSIMYDYGEGEVEDGTLFDQDMTLYNDMAPIIFYQK